MPWRQIPMSDAEVREAARTFRRKTRFYIDADVHPEFADLLRGLGFNVRTAGDAGMGGRSDEDHWALAGRETRLLVTHDTDYLNDRLHPPRGHLGLVVLPQGSTQATIGALRVLVDLFGGFAEAWDGVKAEVHPDGTFTAWSDDPHEGRRVVRRYWLRGADLLMWEDEPEKDQPRGRRQ